jgi:hypothetical protein
VSYLAERQSPDTDESVQSSGALILGEAIITTGSSHTGAAPLSRSELCGEGPDMTISRS